MTTIIQVVFLVSAIALAVLVLLQQSKGSGMGASLGGGASSTVFGARGAGDFLYKTTRLLAGIFFISALLLGYVQNKEAHRSNILERIAVSENQKTEATVDIPSANQQNGSSSNATDIPSASTAPDEKK